MYSMSICLLPMCLFIVMSYVTLLSIEEIKNNYKQVSKLVSKVSKSVSQSDSGGRMLFM